MVRKVGDWVIYRRSLTDSYIVGEITKIWYDRVIKTIVFNVDIKHTIGYSSYELLKQLSEKANLRETTEENCRKDLISFYFEDHEDE